MKAMIMAAGIGTRLRPLTDPLPKPMVPILNTPVMEYSLKLLKKHGVKEIIANTHYNPRLIKDYFGRGDHFGVNLQYSYEETLLGTAGGVKNNKDFLDCTFFVLSGDALTDINLSAMYYFHKDKRSLATLALKSVKDVSSYGVVVIDSQGRIRTFQEKPKREEALSSVVNTGVYLFEPEIFELIPEGFYDFGRELFPKLLEMGAAFYGYTTGDYWCDIGTADIYQQAQADALHRPSLKQLAAEDGLFMLKDNCLAGTNSSIEKSAKLGNNVYIGRNCCIGSRVYLNNCIIWDNCVILEDSIVDNSIIAANCHVGMNSVIGNGVLVGSNSFIGSNIVLNKKCSIEPNSMIVAGKADLA